MISTRNIVLSAASLVAVAQALTVNTPASAVQCQPVALGWGEGTAPFYVSIIPGGQPSAAALENLPTQTGTSYTWMVDIDAGTSITVKVVDSTGEVNYSDQITIQQGTTTECSSSSSSGAAAAGSSAAVAGSSAAASASSAAGSSSSGLASARTPLSSGSTSAAVRSSAATSAASSVSSGVGANAAATISPTGAAAKGATAGMALLGAGLLFALAA